MPKPTSSPKKRVRGKRADAEIAAGDRRGPLHGLRIGIKDNKGIVTESGSQVMAGFLPQYDATCEERLQQAGRQAHPAASRRIQPQLREQY